MAKPALIDTNVLIYAYAEDSPKKAKAADLLLKCFSGEIQAAMSLQNMGEFCSVALNKYKIAFSDVGIVLSAITGSRNVRKLSYSGDTLSRAVKLVEKHGLFFWDAMVAATMLENDMHAIYTEDKFFGRISGIKAVNPFE